MLPLLLAFAWQPGIASMSDDSVSYLALARWIAGAADENLLPWLGWHSHFPPLFPLVLAMTGGHGDFHVAHAVVAVFAALSVWLVARYAAIRLAGAGAATAVALVFVLTPGFWINVKGILSETQFLALSLAALWVHQARLVEGKGRVVDFVLFGVLLAAAHGTRAVGIALVAAYAVHAGVGFVRGDRRARLLLPFVFVALFAATWMLVRPPAHGYVKALSYVLRAWLDNPELAVALITPSLRDGWIASFTADEEVGWALRIVPLAVAVLALCGAARAALRNRLDGWYVLATLAILFLWPYGGDTTLRLFFPVLPLALMHAAEMLQLAARRARAGGLAAMAFIAAAVLSCVPAALVVANRAQDSALLAPDIPHAAREMTPYYRVLELGRARALAAKHAAVIGGLEALDRETPPGARVMWLRPEYVALLGKREGVPLLLKWDSATFARRILEARVDYLIVASLFKSDLDEATGDPARTREFVRPYATPQVVRRNPFTGGEEYVLWRIDPAALRAHVAALGQGQGAFPGGQGSAAWTVTAPGSPDSRSRWSAWGL